MNGTELPVNIRTYRIAAPKADVLLPFVDVHTGKSYQLKDLFKPDSSIRKNLTKKVL